MSESSRADTTVASPRERADSDEAQRAPGAVDGGEDHEPAEAAQVDDATVDGRVTTDARLGDGAADDPGPAVREAGQIAGDDEVEVECPGCGLILVGRAPRPTASWFCPTCDYPVFWASPPSDPPGPTQPRARRRLPGTAGATTLGSAPCWSCGELNEPGSTGCVRCAATLPRPVVTVEPETRIVTVTRAVEVPVPTRLLVWPYVTAGVLGGAALAISVTRWVLLAGGGG
ncbi:MAG: hypothetical protein JJT89_16620 [Nitriliruptoraceae bacterium]|nr:hypothetical protein [Nitriliruptoraceae bacterium]